MFGGAALFGFFVDKTRHNIHLNTVFISEISKLIGSTWNTELQTLLNKLNLSVWLFICT